MKKFFAALLCVACLFSLIAQPVFAKDADEGTDIEFSMTDAEILPGDTVEIEIYLDKNPGTWACCFDVYFNEIYFTLLSVENGDVFTDGEFVKSKLNNRGTYRYYAEGTDPDINNYNTGHILTLTFEVSSAAPAGDYDITIRFPDEGKGWFFDGSEFPDYLTEFSVSCTKTSVVTVKETNSSDTKAEDTQKTPEKDTVDEDAPGLPVYEVVTDAESNVSRNDDGTVVTRPATDENGNKLYYETDGDGDIVTDENGMNKTFVETTAPAETTAKADETTAADGEDGDKEGGLSTYKIILIAAVAAVVVGAIVIIVVLTRPKKKD